MTKRKMLRSLIFVVFLLAFGGVLFSLHRNYVVHTVSGTSMEAALEDGDKVLIKRHDEINRFAIIAFKPTDEQDMFVKRVIGMPGDKILVQNQTLILDFGKNENFASTLRVELSTAVAHELAKSDVIPAGYYFVLGDHIDVSKDSRELGLIKRSAIEGVYQLKIW